MVHPLPADLFLAPAGPRLADQVADDLAAVFGPEGLAVAASAPGRARQIAMTAPRARGRTHLSSIGALAAAALVGLSAGAYLTPRPSAAPTSNVVAPVQTASIAPVSRDLRPVVSALRRTVHAAPTPAELVAEEEPVAQAAAKPKVVKTARAEPSRAVSKVKARPEAARIEGCPGRQDRRACSHADVMAADRGLRRAYARATKAGVPRPTLVAARKRWNDLLRAAPDRPERLVSGYLALSGDLARATDVARADGSPRRYAQS